MIRKGLLAFCIMALVLSAYCPFVSAQGKIRITEKLSMPLGMTLESVFDDNIYLGSGKNPNNLAVNPEETVSDNIMHIKPSIGLIYEMPERGAIGIAYRGDWAHYATETENNWQSHSGLFNFNYQAPGGFMAAANNTYTDAEDPYGDATQFGLGVPNTKRSNNDFKSMLGWNFDDRMKVTGFVNHYSQDYAEDKDKTQNHTDLELGLGVERKIMAKTWAFVRYHYGDVDYDGRPQALPNLNDDNDSDYNFHRVNTGLTWDPGSKVTGELNFGYRWKSFKNDFDQFGNPYKDHDTWIANTVINWEALDNTLVFASLMRSPRVTGGFSGEYFDDTGMSLGIRHKFYTKWTAEALATYSRNEYNTNDRDDDNYEFYAGLGYDIRDWLSVGIDYRYREKDSSSSLPNPELNDYKNNQVTLSGKMQF